MRQIASKQDTDLHNPQQTTHHKDRDMELATWNVEGAEDAPTVPH